MKQIVFFSSIYFIFFFVFLPLSYSDESPLIPNEFLHEPHITAKDLGGDTILKLAVENESDLWINSIPIQIKRSLKDQKQVRLRIIMVWFVF